MHNDYGKKFPVSPWKPVTTTLITLATIQAIALTAAIAVLALRDGSCYL